MVAAADGKPAMIEGYAAVYDSVSQDLGGFVEVVKPGAFAAALAAKPDVRGKYNHEAMLGRTKSGTLRLFDDAKGLRYQIDVPATTVGRDVAESIRRGDVDGSSFCFRVMGSDGESFRNVNGQLLRELRVCQILDVGPVDSPAYLGTEGNLGLRSLPEASRKAAEAVGGTAGPTRSRLTEARLKLAEKGAEGRFYLMSEDPDSACADACRQAGSACDSLCSLGWKVSGLDDAMAAARDAILVCQATACALENEESGIAGDLAAVAAKALRTTAEVCGSLDYPVAKLCAVICQEAADQCDGMTDDDAT
jgi:hypothetical protein